MSYRFADEPAFIDAMRKCKSEAEAIAYARYLKGNISQEDIELAKRVAAQQLAMGATFDFENDRWTNVRER